MKNKLFGILILLFVVVISFSQEEGKDYRRYFSKDQFSFTFTATHWLQKEKVANPSVFSRGIDLQMMYPIIGNNSNVAFAVGFGFSSQNYYLKEYISFNNDSIWFTPIPDSINYKKYKLSTNYITIPVELRFRTNPRGLSRRSFKIYPGFRAGMLVNVHTKYLGKDFETDEKIKEKEYNLKHINRIDYGPTLRIGYGKFMVHGYYSLVNLFEENKGPELTPIEVGVNIILF
ncbi:MAG: PorT family protein [Salinivirgaceae bacterium]|nr:PorT family protein [Salinivirgaceae bacterium]